MTLLIVCPQTANPHLAKQVVRRRSQYFVICVSVRQNSKTTVNWKSEQATREEERRCVPPTHQQQQRRGSARYLLGTSLS